MSSRTGMFTAVDAENDGNFALRDWILFLAVALIWGSSFLLIDVGLDALSPGLITFLRVALGAAAVAVLPRERTPIASEDRVRVFVLSMLWVAIPFTLFPIAEQHINSAVTGLLNGATPIFTAIVATLLVRRPPRGAQLLGIAVGFVGVIMISLPSINDGSSAAFGVALVILATVCYGFSLNIAAPLQVRYGSVGLMARTLALATIWTAPLGVFGLSESTWEWGPVLAVAILGVIGTGAAFALIAQLVGRVGSTRASLITYLIPVVALVLGVTLRGDDVASAALIGIVLVIGGAVLASRRAPEESG
jgi:drug/metabolite transporter (DMT)-like permease